ncbi:unnamed protein product [Cochlearia groenlandica]
MEEDEEEIRSYASPTRSDSPDPYSSPPPSGRNTVTVASTPPSYNNHDALAPSLLPFQTSNVGLFFSGGGIWSDGATEVLIDAWRKRYLKLNGGFLKHKHWQEVAEIVNSSGEGKGKTDAQCRNKIDTVKKKYKQEKARIAYEGGRSNWGFFDILDRLLGSNPAKAKMPISPHGGGASHRGGGIGSSLYHHQQGKAAATRFRNRDSLNGVASDSYGGGGGGGGSRNVPLGIPMSERDNSLGRQGRMVSQQPQGLVFKRCSESKRLGYGLDSEYDAAAMLDDSSDSLPPPSPKRLKMEKKKQEREGGGGSNSKWKELSRAITSLGEAYLETENAKVRQVVEIERARMKFMGEMESQRMQLFQKTILELSRLREQRERKIENAVNDHQSSKATVNKHNNNNNDDGNDDDGDDDDDDIGN